MRTEGREHSLELHISRSQQISVNALEIQKRRNEEYHSSPKTKTALT